MSNELPTVVVVHGALAESASWNGVIERLHSRPVEVIAAANPLRSVSGDAAFVRDVLAGTEGRVVLVRHSYGGMVITEVAAGKDSVVALVCAGAFAPDSGESALTHVDHVPPQHPGRDARRPSPVRPRHRPAIRAGRLPLAARRRRPGQRDRRRGGYQRPVTDRAPRRTSAAVPAWRERPSRFVYGDVDKNIPAARQRFMAERAGAAWFVRCPAPRMWSRFPSRTRSPPRSRRRSPR
jgi:pimeloyl-ACP methyl ester carboxylesterase